jgi:hypothetical protein
VLFSTAGLIAFVLGVAHAGATLFDCMIPTFFTADDDSVRLVMRTTGVSLATSFGAHRTIWDAWLGFNVSHGLGLCIFGAVCMALGRHVSPLEAAPRIQYTLLGVAFVYLLLALRFWFYVPAAGFAIVVFVLALGTWTLRARPSANATKDGPQSEPPP